jgi:hypothetical protein
VKSEKPLPTSDRFVLFVAGKSPNSTAALTHVRRAIERCGREIDLAVIDVFERPDEAFAAHVLVTPALIKADAPGGTRLVGDLSATAELEAFLS